MLKVIRFVLPLSLTLSLAFLAAPGAQAQSAPSWPTQTVRFVVPTPAGSSVDVVARVLAEKLSARLGQNVIVENKAGAGGTIGADAVAKARDRHSFLLGYNGPLSVAPSIFPKLAYRPARDFAPIILVVTQPNVLAVRADLKVDSLKELITRLKAEPGKIDYASVGNGSLSHLAMEMLKERSATRALHIPFNGGPPAALALGRGDVQLMFSAYSNVQPLLKSGQIRLLAVSNAKRSEALPDLPTVAEQGFSGFDATTWNGLLGPADTPPEVVQRLNEALNQILALPEVRQKLLTVGAEAAGGTAEEFAALLKKETATWAAVIERAGIKAD